MEWEVGERFKKGVHMYNLWLVHFNVWQKPRQHCKAIILPLKINSNLKKKIIKRKQQKNGHGSNIVSRNAHWGEKMIKMQGKVILIRKGKGYD